jgi:hypothetical protein
MGPAVSSPMFFDRGGNGMAGEHEEGLVRELRNIRMILTCAFVVGVLGWSMSSIGGAIAGSRLPDEVSSIRTELQALRKELR